MAPTSPEHRRQQLLSLNDLDKTLSTRDAERQVKAAKLKARQRRREMRAKRRTPKAMAAAGTTPTSSFKAVEDIGDLDIYKPVEVSLVAEDHEDAERFSKARAARRASRRRRRNAPEEKAVELKESVAVDKRGQNLVINASKDVEESHYTITPDADFADADWDA